MKIAFWAVVVMLSVIGHAADIGQSADVKKAVDILANENVIVGKYSDAAYGKRPTELAWAFSVVAKSKEAAELFQELAHGGSFYGLIGLAASDKTAFEKEVLRFKGSDVVIVVDQDYSEEIDAGAFIRDHVSKEPKKWYDRLLFDVIPPWQDTVKVKSPLKP